MSLFREIYLPSSSRTLAGTRHSEAMVLEHDRPLFKTVTHYDYDITRA